MFVPLRASADQVNRVGVTQESVFLCAVAARFFLELSKNQKEELFDFPAKPFTAPSSSHHSEPAAEGGYDKNGPAG